MTKMRGIFSTGLVWLWITVLVIVIDRLSKVWVAKHLLFLASMEILPFFNFTLAFNTGAAWSMLDSASGWQNTLFTTIAMIVSVVILIYLYQINRRERLVGVAFSLILAGALGNAWDRITYSYVIDFLDFHLGDWHFAIFNIADSAICIGAFLLFCQWFIDRKKQKLSHNK